MPTYCLHTTYLLPTHYRPTTYLLPTGCRPTTNPRPIDDLPSADLLPIDDLPVLDRQPTCCQISVRLQPWYRHAHPTGLETWHKKTRPDGLRRPNKRKVALVAKVLEFLGKKDLKHIGEIVLPLKRRYEWVDDDCFKPPSRRWLDCSSRWPQERRYRGVGRCGRCLEADTRSQEIVLPTYEN